MYIQDLEHVGVCLSGEGHLVDMKNECGHDKVKEIFFGDEELIVDTKNIGFFTSSDDDAGIFLYQDRADISKFYLIYLEWYHSYYVECYLSELKEALFLLHNK